MSTCFTPEKLYEHSPSITFLSCLSVEDRVTCENVIADINYVKSAPAAQEDGFNVTVLHCSSAPQAQTPQLHRESNPQPHTDQLNKLRLVNNDLVRQSVIL